jgi:hypothetical protein
MIFPCDRWCDLGIMVLLFQRRFEFCIWYYKACHNWMAALFTRDIWIAANLLCCCGSSSSWILTVSKLGIYESGSQLDFVCSLHFIVHQARWASWGVRHSIEKWSICFILALIEGARIFHSTVSQYGCRIIWNAAWFHGISCKIAHGCTSEAMEYVMI